jgi:hypothetical protein
MVRAAFLPAFGADCPIAGLVEDETIAVARIPAVGGDRDRADVVANDDDETLT